MTTCSKLRVAILTDSKYQLKVFEDNNLIPTNEVNPVQSVVMPCDDPPSKVSFLGGAKSTDCASTQNVCRGQFWHETPLNVTVWQVIVTPPAVKNVTVEWLKANYDRQK